jgi:hypothetical protein
MFKKLSLVLVSGALVFSVTACGKQEQAKAPEAPAANQGTNLALPQKGQEATVNVPAEVKSAWKAIKLSVEDKASKSKKEVVCKIGEETKIPGTKLTVKPLEFVPSFVMQGLNITSASNEPNNPAVKVVITEDGKEVFKGWLFQKFPTTHAFSHPNYAITLLEGMKS